MTVLFDRKFHSSEWMKRGITWQSLLLKFKFTVVCHYRPFGLEVLRGVWRLLGSPSYSPQNFINVLWKYKRLILKEVLKLWGHHCREGRKKRKASLESARLYKNGDDEKWVDKEVKYFRGHVQWRVRWVLFPFTKYKEKKLMAISKLQPYIQ